MKIASDAWNFFLPLAAASIFFFYAGIPITGAVTVVLALFVLFFFRDPSREISSNPAAAVSPADGTVARIDHDWYDETTGEKRIRISIFLTIFNVHINRFPVSGKIVSMEFREGKYLAAFNHLASEENSQSIVVINSDYGKVTVKQIVGLIARRIVCSARQGDMAVKGERYGLIRFGSRMDITFPANTELKVKVKDKVQGGSSVLAHLVS
ncbi:MAG: phosphatidylserine decarboxylase proenzyme [bacterium]|nr:MAG: phosphatidylserine decarboxylase proenzyme [bacterium]